ncbi:ABC transporter ATP-binding protein [Actinomyces haliotis]|uniref:ABC transporter ATP-binding protein n=1 Tax=Actinomyces haliotis TaxID=1280843 RepID=UPI00188EC2B3|nr:oligopeptide/dipeptide ABC transporter ATP-binding protein [Actinomyces haliotis]
MTINAQTAAETPQELISTPELGAPVLEIDHLSKDFNQGGLLSRQSVHALSDVSLTLRKGEILALVGESGSGKSTLARIVSRLEKPTSGRFLVDGEDVLAKERHHVSRAYRGRVQMVFQDPFGSLNPVHTIGHVLRRSLAIHQPGRRSARRDADAAELMATVGLETSMLDSYPHQLSGGQRQRVAIARALACDPQILLADEPTSMLDISVRIGILNLMLKLRDERGLSMLYITHDLASARYVADTTAVLFGGELVESGPSVDVMDHPDHPYTKLLLSAVPDPTRRLHLPVDERRALRESVIYPEACPHEGAEVVCSSTDPVHHQVGPDHWVRCHRYVPRAASGTALTTDMGQERSQ